MAKSNPIPDIILPQPRQKPYLPTLLSQLLRRSLDLIGALVGLILLAPLFAFIALLIKRDSPGPVLYRGPRVGKNGREFHILKFRTMYETEESYNGHRVTAHDDPRITPFGRWLRDTKLNELPQLWNVLKGEMSLVGPRPEDPDIVAAWPDEVRREILSVRPGITSPASVMYRGEEALLSAGQVMDTYLSSILPSKLRLDQLYVRHRSFWLDLDVLFWTLLVLIPRIGKKEPPEDILFLGPISRLVTRYLNWFVLDTLVTLAAFGLVGVFWRTFVPINVGWPTAAGMSLVFAFIFSVFGAVFGVNRVAWSKAVAEDVFDLVFPVLLATLAVTGLNLTLHVFPLGLVWLGSLGAFTGFVVARYRSRLITGALSRLVRLRNGVKVAREQVLIIGGGDAGQFAAWMLQNSLGTQAFHVVGFVDDDLYKQGVRIRGFNVLGRREDIPQLVVEHDVGLIVFAIHNITPQERHDLLGICHQSSAQVVILPDFVGTMRTVMANERQGYDPNRASEVLDALDLDGEVVPVAELSAWVGCLAQAAQHGDLQGVQQQIMVLQEQLRQSHPTP